MARKFFILLTLFVVPFSSAVAENVPTDVFQKLKKSITDGDVPAVEALVKQHQIDLTGHEKGSGSGTFFAASAFSPKSPYGSGLGGSTSNAMSAALTSRNEKMLSYMVAIHGEKFGKKEVNDALKSHVLPQYLNELAKSAREVVALRRDIQAASQEGSGIHADALTALRGQLTSATRWYQEVERHYTFLQNYLRSVGLISRLSDPAGETFHSTSVGTVESYSTH